MALTLWPRVGATSSRLGIGQVLSGVKQRRCLNITSLRHFNKCSSNLVSHSSREGSAAISDILHIHPHVSSALSSKEKAVVALESTIVTHGMPYPHNLRTAIKAKEIIILKGAVPATIAALDGKLCIGLTRDQLENLAATQEAVKTSRRDLAWVLSQKTVGGTTVSATMVGAHLAGIDMFVTGGIGGVHRGGETTLDISADLTELGRTPITVVSAGIKSILDIPRTLEYLETQGVTVAVYGSSPEFPAFFTRHSGVKCPINVRTPREAAELIDSNLSLNLGSGILIAVPIPEEFAAEGEEIEGAIQNAVAEASQRGISGNDVTPFILQRVNELTRGKSLEANKALLLNNAEVGTAIANHLTSMKRRSHYRHSQKQERKKRSRSNKSLPAGRPVVIGASIVDYTARAAGGDLVYGGTTNVGQFHVSYGGVGRNIADALTRLGADPIFLSAVGKDHAGKTLQSNCSHMDFSKVSQLYDARTATYCLVLGRTGEVEIGIGDMEINNTITPYYLSQHAEQLKQAPLVCMDGNIPVESIEYVASFCNENTIPLWFEPTCVVKGTKVCQSGAYKKLTYASPNVNELRKMYEAITGEETEFKDDLSLTDKLQECIKLCQVLMGSMYCLVVTLGKDGVLVCTNGVPGHPGLLDRDELQRFLLDRHLHQSSLNLKHTVPFHACHYPAWSVADNEGSITSVSGGGDCLAAAIIVGMLQGYPQHACVHWGLLAARHSLRSHHAVPDSINEELLAHISPKSEPPEPTKFQDLWSTG